MVEAPFNRGSLFVLPWRSVSITICYAGYVRLALYSIERGAYTIFCNKISLETNERIDKVMGHMKSKTIKDTRVVQTDQVLINDLNNYHTLFGGVLMKKLDACATLSARRHARVQECVTASTDSVNFIEPIRQSDSVCIESCVTYTGKSSMEIFCKVIAEDMITAERKIAATAFLTFVALGDNKKPITVPEVVPETEEEKFLYQTGAERAKMRRLKRQQNKELVSKLTLEKPIL